MLNRDSGETVSVSVLAESCSMSETYFRRLFSQAYGMSPQSYKTHRRISYACDLLDNTSLSIESVSYECGYRDHLFALRLLFPLGEKSGAHIAAAVYIDTGAGHITGFLRGEVDHGVAHILTAADAAQRSAGNGGVQPMGVGIDENVP